MNNKQCSDSAQKGPGVGKTSLGSPVVAKPDSIKSAAKVPSHSRGKDGKSR